MPAKPTVDADGHVRALLARGWRWHEAHADRLVHPQDYNLFVVYDRAAGRLAYSAALVAALERVIPTPASQNPHFWRDDQKAHAGTREVREARSSGRLALPARGPKTGGNRRPRK